MERTVPSTGSEEIALYLRTYYSLLRTTSEIQIRTLEEAHAGMRSLLHPLARGQKPDLSAFIYSLLRLPEVVDKVKLVILGQSTEAYVENGYPDVDTWEVAEAPARRRRCFYDGESTLACYIASRTDIDDIIPLLTAYQIEWNKLHLLLSQLPRTFPLESVAEQPESREKLAQILQMPVDDLDRLLTLWGEDFPSRLGAIAERSIRFKVRLLDSSLSGYRRATNAWWQGVVSRFPALIERPLYIVSSNTHTVINLLSGFALRHPEELLAFLEQAGSERLQQEWRDIQTRQVPSSRENYFYYLLKNYLTTDQGAPLNAARLEDERTCGITRIPPLHAFDIESQVIELAKLKPDLLDPRLKRPGLSMLANSPAMILNIDYPLGLAAYNLLTKVSEHNHEILGVYSMGKAATLNGVIGDIMIPNVIHDEHSGNTYLFSNCFSAADVAPHLVYGTVLDNQKGVSVRGTFLQNDRYMDVFYREGYTDIEMEAGPFLSAIYEMSRPNRHPADEIVNLYEVSQDIGFLHYASDTPLSKGKNLGAGSLSYFGMDPTYASALAILVRIIHNEIARLSMETH
jgi:hypothetical protein